MTAATPTRSPAQSSGPATTIAGSSAPGDPTAYVPYMFALMLRNVATWGFQIADHNAPGDPGGYTATGCVIASPSWSVNGAYYPGDVAAIAEDYFFSWTRDSAITMSAVLSAAPNQIPTAGASELFANYVDFASTCEASGGGIGGAKYTPEGVQTGAADESDGPALRILTILEGYAGLDSATRNVAQAVIATDFHYLLDNNRYQQPTVTHWEDTFGQLLFARPVQLRALNQIIANGPTLGIRVPAGAPAAVTFFTQQLPLHFTGASGTPPNVYKSVLNSSRLSGDPAAAYDPGIDPILACVYGDGIAPTDPKLLSTAAQVRAQWGPGGSSAYSINAADQAASNGGPLVGRYLGDEYDGLSLTSNTGHPCAVCTGTFAQLSTRWPPQSTGERPCRTTRSPRRSSARSESTPRRERRKPRARCEAQATACSPRSSTTATASSSASSSIRTAASNGAFRTSPGATPPSSPRSRFVNECPHTASWPSVSIRASLWSTRRAVQ